jgi:hypothetical protein
MERRLKLGLISMSDLESHGKNAGDALKKILESTGVTKITQEDDFRTGSLKIVLYCEKWPIVKLGGKLETITIPLGEPEKVVKIAYNH